MGEPRRGSPRDPVARVRSTAAGHQPERKRRRSVRAHAKSDGKGIDCRQWLDELIGSVSVAREGRDPEGVHQLRVAVARIRVWLALAGLRVYQDDLRWLRDHAAAVRDVDVHLARNPPLAIARRLRRLRAAARRDLLAALDDPRVRGLIVGLAAMPAVPRDRAERETRRIALDVLARGRRMMKHPDDPDALHDLRIGARRLRFAREWTGKDSKSIETIQEALGEVGDRLTALRHVGSADRMARSTRAYRTRLRREFERASERAVHDWKQTRPVVAGWS